MPKAFSVRNLCNLTATLEMTRFSDDVCFMSPVEAVRVQCSTIRYSYLVQQAVMPQGTSTNQATTIKIPFFMQVNSKPCLMAYKGPIAILWQFLSKIPPDFCMQIVMVLSCTQTLIIKKWRFIKQGLKLMKLLSQCQKSVPLYGNEHFCAAIWWQTLLPNDLLSLFTIQTTQKNHQIMKIKRLDMQ
ncbi:hypothetical protein [Aeromonas veronii]|uniref:hypothetical protein n=1 Tax=Aeromonas veronii TaxID=654 RepID=UPI00117876FD|nr:hypothetical protein [Aeromonas veronii]